MTEQILILMIFALAFSARWNWWRPKQKGIAVLMYHNIGRVPHKDRKSLWVSQKKFETQINFLIKKGYTFLGFSDLTEKLLPEKSVIITFDDGYKNNLSAIEFLIINKIKSNMFLVYNAIGKKNYWDINSSRINAEEKLDLDTLKNLKSSGLVEFGVHTMDHKNLTEIDAKEIKKQVIESKQNLEKTFEIEMNCFAYPYGAGAFKPEIKKIVEDAGFVFNFSVKQNLWDFSNWDKTKSIPRVFVRGDDNMLDFKLKLIRGKSRL